MRFLFFVMLAAFFVGPASGQTLSREAFRDAYVAALKAEQPEVVTEIDPADAGVIRIKRPGDDDYTAFLDNAYKDYLHSPEDLAEILGKHSRLALGRSPDQYADASLDRLVALPRSASIKQSAPPGAAFIERPFVGDLILVLMIDASESLRYAKPEELEQLKLSTDQAFAVGQQNIRKRVGDVEESAIEGIHVTGAESGLAPGLLSTAAYCAAGTPDRLVLVADRFYFFWVSSADAAAAQSLRRVARAMIADGESLSSTLIECKAGAWRVASLN